MAIPAGTTAAVSLRTAEVPIFFYSQRNLNTGIVVSLPKSRLRRVCAVQETKEPSASSSSDTKLTEEETTEKYGLEVGLWKIFTSKDGDGDGKGKARKTEKAKDLLAKYGGAYLLTSITLSLISFSLCYILVNAGIDVPGLLLKVGISVDETGENVGKFALAYAAHKAASPIRFPPTVALTPVVAGWIGKVKDGKTFTGNEDDTVE